MKKSKYLVLTMAAIIAFCSGCAIKGTVRRNNSGIYPAASAEIGVDYIDYKVKLGNKIQTTPVHDDDGGPSIGEATAKVNGGSTASPRLGLEASLGTDDIRLSLGFDIRYNELSDSDENSKDIDGLYGTASQSLPPPYDSRTFTRLTLDQFTYTPKVGIEAAVSETVTLGAEYGLPYTWWEVLSGHYRFDAREVVQRASHSGFGKSIGGSIGYEVYDNTSIRFVLKNERYSPTFAGERAEIDALVWFIGIEKRF